MYFVICFHRTWWMCFSCLEYLICTTLTIVIPSMLQYPFKYYPIYWLFPNLFSFSPCLCSLSSLPQLSVFFSYSFWLLWISLCHLTYNGIILWIFATLLVLSPTSNGCFISPDIIMLTLFGPIFLNDMDKCITSKLITFVDDVKLGEEPMLWYSRKPWEAEKVDQI